MGHDLSLCAADRDSVFMSHGSVDGKRWHLVTIFTNSWGSTGLPLSTLLFAISIDPLLPRISTCPGIQGFPLPGRGATKVSAYAEDIPFFASDKDSILSFFHLFNEYSCLYGAQLNPAKPRALLFGTITRTHICSISVAPKVRVLGVNFISCRVSTTTWGK